MLSILFAAILALGILPCSAEQSITPPLLDDLVDYEDATVDYFPHEPGYAVIYSAKDQISGDSGDFELAFQDIDMPADPSISVFVTLNSIKSKKTGSSMGARVKSDDSISYLSFFSGMSSSNIGNILYMVQIPLALRDGLLWKDFYGVSHTIKARGEYKIGDNSYDDCILIEFDSSDVADRLYCKNGKGYYILAKGIGLVEFKFKNNIGKNISINIKDRKYYGNKTIVEGTVTNDCGAVEGVGVMISTIKVDQLAITDRDGKFSISYWGGPMTLRVGTIDEQGDFLDMKKVEHFKYNGEGIAAVKL